MNPFALAADAAAPVMVFGAHQKKTFDINVDPVIFHLMSDIVYTAPALAVVREYLTNAWDAHIEAGTTDQPVRLEFFTEPPRFIVSDRGTGLDEAGMDEIFRFYFRSTKRGDDRVTGKFGIGSKVAFAYTDQFTATAVRDGRRHVYAMHLGPDRRPTVANMTPHGGVACADPNGLAIDIPLKDAADIDVLRLHAERMLAHSAINAEIVLDGAVVMSSADHKLGSALLEHGFALDLLTMPEAPLIVQGEIPYRLTSAHGTFTPNQRRLILRSASRAFTYSLSREQLRYDPDNLAAIKTAIESAWAQIAAAYRAVFLQKLVRLPIGALASLIDQPMLRRSLSEGLAYATIDQAYAAGPRDIAVALNANGSDGDLFDALLAEALQRRYRKSRSPLEARAAFERDRRRAVMRLAGALHVLHLPDADLRIYERESRTAADVWQHSKNIILAPGPFKANTCAYTPHDKIADANPRRAAIGTATTICTAAQPGLPHLILRPHLGPRLYFAVGDRPGPFGFVAVRAAAGAETALISPEIVSALRKLFGSANILVDPMTPWTSRPRRKAAPQTPPAEPVAAPALNKLTILSRLNTHYSTRTANRTAVTIMSYEHVLPSLPDAYVSTATRHDNSLRVHGGMVRVIDGFAHLFPKGTKHIVLARGKAAAAALAAQGVPCLDEPAPGETRDAPSDAEVMTAALLKSIKWLNSRIISRDSVALAISLLQRHCQRVAGGDLHRNAGALLARLPHLDHAALATASRAASSTLCAAIEARYPLLFLNRTDKTLSPAILDYCRAIDEASPHAPALANLAGDGI